MLDKESVEKHGAYNHDLKCLEAAVGIDGERMCYLLDFINKNTKPFKSSLFIELLENMDMTKREMAAITEIIFSQMVEARGNSCDYTSLLLNFLSSMVKKNSDDIK